MESKRGFKYKLIIKSVETWDYNRNIDLIKRKGSNDTKSREIWRT